jgi:hypothetical protein
LTVLGAAYHLFPDHLKNQKGSITSFSFPYKQGDEDDERDPEGGLRDVFKHVKATVA